jgi:3-hydroxyacyl-CoA dehydrogenase
MSFNEVAVIGAGQMGSGIAHVCALAGYKVQLIDMTMDRAEAGIATITGNMNRQVTSGRISESEREAALDRIRPWLRPDRPGRSRRRSGNGKRGSQTLDLYRDLPADFR